MQLIFKRPGQSRYVTKEPAFSQISLKATRDESDKVSFQGVSIKNSDIKAKYRDEIIELYLNSINDIKLKLSSFDSDKFKGEFLSSTQNRESEYTQLWSDEWKKKCDGKALIKSVHQFFGIKMSLTALIMRNIIQFNIELQLLGKCQQAQTYSCNKHSLEFGSSGNYHAARTVFGDNR